MLAKDGDWENVASTRAAAHSGLPGGRILVDRSHLGRAPFADNSVDLILVAGLDDQTLAKLPARECSGFWRRMACSSSAGRTRHPARD